MKTRVVRTWPFPPDGVFREQVFRQPRDQRPFQVTFDNSEGRQAHEPIRGVGAYESETGVPAWDDDQAWLFRGRLVLVEEPYTVTLDEVELAVRHEVLALESQLADNKRKVELWEKAGTIATSPREPIPKDVRLFVWRRDEGQCVQCGSNQALEFDHIIPVAKGGSSTERNLQLLCEHSNRKKGSSV